MYSPGMKFQDELGVPADEEYLLISKEQMSTDPKFSKCRKAAHVMLYALCNAPVLNVYDPKAIVFMQMRFDGHVGFPGGLVDDNETAEEAVNRELVEEVGIEPGQLSVDDEELVAIHYCEIKALLLLLYMKQISINAMREIEKSSLQCLEWGDEVMGIVRVPLYTMSDGFRGFPAFLYTPFIGNAKEQLLLGLKKAGLMTHEKIQSALNATPKIVKIHSVPSLVFAPSSDTDVTE